MKKINIISLFTLLLLSSLLTLKSCSSVKTDLDKNEQLVSYPKTSYLFLKTEQSDVKMIDKIALDSSFIKGEIKDGQGLTAAIMDLPNTTTETALKITNILMENVDFRALKIGQQFAIKYKKNSTELEQFIFFETKVKYLTIQKDSTNTNLVCLEQRLPTTKRLRTIDGKIEKTLDGSLRVLDIDPQARQTVNNILECTVSFQSDARTGDQFKILLEEEFFEDSIFVSSKVLYSSYSGSRAGFHECFFYEEADEKSAFNAHYTRDGRALVNSGFRIPVDRVHITSPFGYRIHPITGLRAMHNGVDYAGSTGSPVYVAAPGKVKMVKYDPFGGKQIIVKHVDNSETYYLHLNSFNVRIGQGVKSRQVIGAIGSTGRSTGPHLHFGIKQNNKWVNPLAKNMIATPKLEGEKLKALQKRIIEIEKLKTNTTISDQVNKRIENLFYNSWQASSYIVQVLANK